MNLDLRQDGQEGGSDAEEHVDADEDLVLGAAIRVGVVHVEHGQSHHRQQVVDRGDRQQSWGHKTGSLEHTSQAAARAAKHGRAQAHPNRKGRGFLPGAPFWLVWSYGRKNLSALQPWHLLVDEQTSHFSTTVNKAGTFTDIPSLPDTDPLQTLPPSLPPSGSGTFPTDSEHA